MPHFPHVLCNCRAEFLHALQMHRALDGSSVQTVGANATQCSYTHLHAIQCHQTPSYAPPCHCPAPSYAALRLHARPMLLPYPFQGMTPCALCAVCVWQEAELSAALESPPVEIQDQCTELPNKVSCSPLSLLFHSPTASLKNIHCRS